MALEQGLGLGQEPVLRLLQHRNDKIILHIRCNTDLACTAKHARPCGPFLSYERQMLICCHVTPGMLAPGVKFGW